eukprot:CAMPEP_0168257374 /NCGR_PEP_ID=MMETSP0141_2-20121125/6474_1 /TAXON_ID=44445 /ORGANISM="Pseudo-nitzschia australis, Strain 10249 10 AB" /LENGTH=192 /DNA_ID=CAMNT_0008194377 /DNA_START=152 /DNA_END=730 /DNA_ORIENTATION=-
MLAFALALAWTATVPNTRAFAPIAGCTRTIATTTTTQLGAGPVAAAAAAAAATTATATAMDAAPSTADTAAAFADRIDGFGDPTVRTIVLVFAGVVLVLGGLAVLSQKMDAAIETVLVEFETVLSDPSTTDKGIREAWQTIEPQLRAFDNEVEKSRMRKQKLFAIMEELERTEPALMKRVSAEMAALDDEPM